MANSKGNNSKGNNSKGNSNSAAAPTTAPAVPARTTAKPGQPAPYSGGVHGVWRAKDLPWCSTKVKVLGALVKLGATSASTAKGSNAVAQAAGVAARQVRHYCYYAQAAGLTAVYAGTGPGYLYAITPAGAAALKAHLAQQAQQQGK